MPDTLENAAREAFSQACDDVRAAGENDLVDGVVPGLVARPRSTEEVSEVMAVAAAHGLTVTPRGRGTKMSWGRPPAAADLVVDISAMDRVLDHQAGDLIVSTQAGARLSDVQRTVSAGRQRMSVEEMMAGASIGGILATNTSGPSRLVAGTLRDLLIGITVVRADGVVAKAGGRVVKNVAGYDLGKLMVGSFGTLAVITEALFRLHPLAEVQQWVSIAVADPAELHELVQSVVHSQSVPAAVEVDWPAGGTGQLSVLLEGRPEGVEGRARTVSGLLGAASSMSDHAPAGWASYPWNGGDTALKLTCVLSGLREVVAAACEAGATLRGSAGTGVLYAAVHQPEQAAAAVERLREVCTRHGGSLVVLDAPSEVKRSLDVWGPVDAIDLMRRVKDRFDPDRRLSPGRFVGGI